MLSPLSEQPCVITPTPDPNYARPKSPAIDPNYARPKSPAIDIVQYITHFKRTKTM